MKAWGELTQEQADAVLEILEDESRMIGGWGLPTHLENGPLELGDYQEAIDAALERLRDGAPEERSEGDDDGRDHVPGTAEAAAEGGGSGEHPGKGDEGVRRLHDGDAPVPGAPALPPPPPRDVEGAALAGVRHRPDEGPADRGGEGLIALIVSYELIPELVTFPDAEDRARYIRELIEQPDTGDVDDWLAATASGNYNEAPLDATDEEKIDWLVGHYFLSDGNRWEVRVP